MRIQFVQSGGFAGTIRHCTLDTASMSTAEAAELESLVSKAELDESAPTARSAAARDLEEFQLSIEDDQGKKTIVRDQSTLSQGGKVLVAYLKKCAKPGMPKE